MACNTLHSYDPEIKVQQRHGVPISHPLIEQHISLHYKVMIHRDDRFTRGTHFKVHRDEGGFYVRMGKRGQCKRYIIRCDVTWMQGNPVLFQYRLAAR